ncbi:MAG: hypothetical protein A2Y71_09070 [Bacteroidetes bacterium RBG_13_42_15]|nr:MAG: hypothetical protein A2Y71_09070 [Bacteroidetes bacterium RBG_13_42_15]
MKKILICLTAIALLGCTSQTQKPMTDVEEETIKSEVKKDFNVMLELVQKLDLETAFKYYLDSPDFMGIGPDGMIMDFAQFKKANEDMVNAAKSMHFTTIKEDIKVLGSDQVFFIYQYSGEIILNNGEKIAYDKIAMTLLYKKVEGVWKIVFFHESALPPVMTKLSE